MLPGEYSLAKRCLSFAITAEDRGNYTDAKRLYSDALSHLEKTLRISTDPNILSRSRNFQKSALERIAFIDSRSKSDALLPNGAGPSCPERVARSKPDKTTLMKALKNVSEKLVDRILNEVFEDCSSVTLDSVAGNNRAKQILNETVILPALRPELFTGLRTPVRGILLFGPPGNGKTMLAKAIASESNCLFFNISAASLFSKWLGESENLVRALFSIARQVQPSIIFLDEVDSLLIARKDNSGHEASRRVLTQLLAEMDGFGSSSQRVLVLAATNRPNELDDAALRRFSRRVYVRMPDVAGRYELLRKLLTRDTPHSLSDADVRRIASLTEGYSASDLKELAKESALQPVREIDPSRIRTISADNVRPMTKDDFLRSMKTVKPSLARESLVFYDKWNNKFGESVGVTVRPSGSGSGCSLRRLLAEPLGIM